VAPPAIAQKLSKDEDVPLIQAIIYMTKHTDSGIGSSRQAGAEMDKIHGFIREAVIEEIMECFDGTDSRRIFEEEASLIAAQVNRRVSQKIAGS